MKKLLSMGLLVLLTLFAQLQAQTCSDTGPFVGHNFTVSAPYTIANGNTGVAILYRNSAGGPVNLNGLTLTVTSNSCGACGLIQAAILTSFSNTGAVATVSLDQRTATFGWNGVPTHQTFPLVDNEVIMVLDLGGPLCGNAACFDLTIGGVAMVVDFAVVPQAQVGVCERQICKAAFTAACSAAYGAAGFFPSPYGQPTLSPSDDYTTKGGLQTSAIQFWDPAHDPWANIFAPSLCVTGVHFEINLTGNLVLTGWTNNTFPGATITQPSPDRIIFHYFGAPQQIYSSDVFLLLHFLNNGGCGSINICTVFIQTCQGEQQLNNVTACMRRLCIGTPGKAGEEDVVATRPDYAHGSVLAYPNPFLDRTKITFALPESMDVTFKVLATNGQLIHSEMIQAKEGMNEIQFLADHKLPAGIYLYQLESAKGTYHGKFVHQ